MKTHKQLLNFRCSFRPSVGLGWLSILLLIRSATLYAQNGKEIAPAVAKNSTKDTTTRHTGTPQKDITDELHFLFPHKKAKNATDSTEDVRKPTFSGLPAVGYTLTTKTAITLTGNAAFRTNADAKISTVTSSVAYTQNKQFTFPLETNIWTKEDKYNFVGDIHFMKYPQSTFGLGSNSWIGNEDPMDYSYIRFYEIVLRKITANFFAGGGYILDWRYNITEDNPKSTPTDYDKYGPSATTLSTGFTLNALYDTRDNSINPYKGFYANGTYRDNLAFMGSNSNWQSLILDVRKFFTFPAASHPPISLSSRNRPVSGVGSGANVSSSPFHPILMPLPEALL